MTDSRARGGVARTWLIWFGGAVLLTLLLVLLRDRLDKSHVALLLLLPVLGGAAQGGRSLGLALAAFTFLCFNFFFLAPHYTFVVFDPLDWLVLAIYLITASVAAQLLHRVRRLQARESELRAASDVKDAVLAAVSHDLRTPLTTIKALAHDLVEQGSINAADIETQADHLNRIVVDLLDLSRLRAGATLLHPEINAAEDLIGAAIDQLARQMPQRVLETRIDTHGPMLLGRFDFVHTLRIIANLVENSHKYSPAGEPIVISAVREGASLVFSVADRGRGIPSDVGDQIYEPFYRAAPGPGAGLGLSIARQLAQLQGGTLTHTNATGGAVFTLRLPAVDPP